MERRRGRGEEKRGVKEMGEVRRKGDQEMKRGGKEER